MLEGRTRGREEKREGGHSRQRENIYRAPEIRKNMTCSFFLFPFLLEDNIPNLCWLGYILSIVFSYVLEDYRQIGANVGGKQLR